MVAKNNQVEYVDGCPICFNDEVPLHHYDRKLKLNICDDCWTKDHQKPLAFDEYDLQPDEITKEQFAEKAGVSIRAIEIWKKSGKIPARKLRRRVNDIVRPQLIFNVTDVESFLQDQNSPINLPIVEMDAIKTDAIKTNDNENSLSDASHLFVLDAVEKITNNLKHLNMQQQLPAAPGKQSQFMTIKEASDETRLAQAEINRLIDSEIIKSFKGNKGEKLVSRKEIENL